MDDKTRMRCNNCGSEFDEECTEYYLETDDPESDCIGHCPVCWGKDIAAISIIDLEAIRREKAEEIYQAGMRHGKWFAMNTGPLKPVPMQPSMDDAIAAILAHEPNDMPKCTRPLDMECHAHSGDNCYNGFQCDPISDEPKERDSRDGQLYKPDVDGSGEG